MVIARDNIISICYNGTIHKLVVVRINRDEIEVVSWIERYNKRGNGFDKNICIDDDSQVFTFP